MRVRKCSTRKCYTLGLCALGTLLVVPQSKSSAAVFLNALQLTSWAPAWTPAPVDGGANPTATVSVDENGNGVISGPGGTFPTAGTLKPDPGPGGLGAALTYGLLGPPSLVAGDLEMSDGVGMILDIVRFNPAGTGGNPAYPASLVFYSDNTDGIDAIGDTTSPPSALYPNNLTIPEVGPEGNNGAVYTPAAGQPGFIAGFDTTYHLISDGVLPEPGSMGMIVFAVAMLSRRRRVA